MQDPQRPPQPDQPPPFYPVTRAEPDDNKAALYGRFGQGVQELFLRGVPWIVRLQKSLRVGSGAATLKALDGTDGAIMADGASAALLSRDRADATKYVAVYRNGTIRIATELVDLILLDPVTGRGITTSLRAYSAATDLMSSTAISATTWTDLATVTSGFTPANANSTIWASVRGVCNITAAAGSGVGGRLLVDGTTAYPLSGGVTGPATSYVNPLGGQMVPLGAFSAANHTLKVQVWCGAAATGFCRASTQPNFEFLNVDVWEVRS